jgi:hypothetical protein
VTWTPINLAPDGGVLATVTKTQVILSLAPSILRQLGLSEDEPNVSLALGDGENAGWLRIVLDEEGMTPDSNGEGALISLPRSMLPDLQPCRRSPLNWRKADLAVEVRLPTVAAVAANRRPSPRLAAVGGRPVDDVPKVEAAAPPELYQQLHADAWRVGVELTFLTDGTCAVSGQIMSIEEMEPLVLARIKAAGSRSA